MFFQRQTSDWDVVDVGVETTNRKKTNWYMKPTTKNGKVKREQTSDGPMMRDDRGEMKDDDRCEEG